MNMTYSDIITPTILQKDDVSNFFSLFQKITF